MGPFRLHCSICSILPSIIQGLFKLVRAINGNYVIFKIQSFLIDIPHGDEPDLTRSLFVVIVDHQSSKRVIDLLG